MNLSLGGSERKNTLLHAHARFLFLFRHLFFARSLQRRADHVALLYPFLGYSMQHSEMHSVLMQKILLALCVMYSSHGCAQCRSQLCNLWTILNTAIKFTICLRVYSNKMQERLSWKSDSVPPSVLEMTKTSAIFQGQNSGSLRKTDGRVHDYFRITLSASWIRSKVHHTRFNINIASYSYTQINPARLKSHPSSFKNMAESWPLICRLRSRQEINCMLRKFERAHNYCTRVHLAMNGCGIAEIWSCDLLAMLQPYMDGSPRQQISRDHVIRSTIN